jgi:peptidoglycan/LPS O-acetylase OafA/YrhL
VKPPLADPAAPRNPAARPYLHAFDGLRFLAAMHVVVFHTLHAQWLSPRLMRPITWGSTSTSLLFLLSGFVLTYVYAGEDGLLRIGRGDFLWRRLSRLVPLTLFGHLLTVPLVWHAYPAGERVTRAAVTLVGMQAWFPDWATSFNSPGWSVSAMLLWYSLLPGILIAVRGWSPRRALLGMAATWLAALLPVAAYLRWGAGDPYWYSAVNHHPLARLPEFVFGVLVAVLLRRGWRPSPWLLPAGLVGWLAAVVALPDGAYLLAHNGLLAPVHALVLLGIAGGAGRVLTWPPLVSAGEAGFAIFLLHVPIYSWLVLPFASTLSDQPAALRYGVYFLYLAATVVLSWASQRYITRRLTRRLRALATPAAAAGVAASPAG